MNAKTLSRKGSKVKEEELRVQLIPKQEVSAKSTVVAAAPALN